MAFQTKSLTVLAVLVAGAVGRGAGSLSLEHDTKNKFAMARLAINILFFTFN
jgi:hypothetical protein